MTRKNTFFYGWSWFKFNNLALALGTNLKFYNSVAKGLKLKVRMFWGLISTFVEVTGEKLVGGPFCPSPILNRVKFLTECRFKVRMIISVNHPCNRSAYHKILNHFSTPCDNLYFMYESEKIYLCFDTVHLIKSIRNNLLNNKRFIFAAFTFETLMIL